VFLDLFLAKSVNDFGCGSDTFLNKVASNFVGVWLEL